jgi:hypothetical protein
MGKKINKVEPWGVGRPDYSAPLLKYTGLKDWIFHHWIGVTGLIIAILSLIGMVFL